MTFIKKLSLLSFATLIFSVSCTKTTTPTPGSGSTTSANTISCKINGAVFNSATNNASYQFIQLMVVGSSGDFLTKIDMTAVVSGKVGTYDLKDNANYTLNKKISPAVYGTLNLTKFDANLRLVSGTFSYTTQDSTKITEGIFTEVSY